MQMSYGMIIVLSNLLLALLIVVGEELVLLGG